MAGPSYGPQVLDHYLHPRNVGSYDPLDSQVGSALVGSPALGQVLKLQIRLVGGRIASACFRAYGCGATIAAGSWTTEWLRGRSLAEARDFPTQAIIQALELPAIKQHCALLAKDAIVAAINDYSDKHRS
jgi:nitrogen fixation NifU-like protein